MPPSTLAPTLTRPIHYLGSKLRIVESVREVVQRVDTTQGPVCDLFSGSGTVSRALSTSRTVISVDTQEYSRVLCSALLQPAYLDKSAIEAYLREAFCSEHAERLWWAIQPMITHEANCRLDAELGQVEPLCELLEKGSLTVFERNPTGIGAGALRESMLETLSRMLSAGIHEKKQGLVMRYFGGVYFSYRQACELDMLLRAVHIFPALAHDTIRAAVLSTASDLVNTVGKQFAQPIRPRNPDGTPKAALARRIARDRDIDGVSLFKKWIVRYLSLPQLDAGHQAWRCDFREALLKLSGKVSIVYADPPYTRDHYSRFYHVLETLCLYDFPPVSTVRVGHSDFISRGVYRAGRYQSPFCIKSKAPDAFSDLFAGVRRLGVPLVLSYSPFAKETGARPRLVSISELVRLASQWFPSVEVITPGRIAHSKLNRVELNKPSSSSAEKLLICKP